MVADVAAVVADIAAVVAGTAAGREVEWCFGSSEEHWRVGESRTVELDWGSWVRHVLPRHIDALVVVLRLELLVLLRTCLVHRPNTFENILRDDQIRSI